MTLRTEVLRSTPAVLVVSFVVCERVSVVVDGELPWLLRFIWRVLGWSSSFPACW
jgi:hypothetical protein